MKILVPIKRVVDSNVRIRVKADGSGVDTTNLKMSMNPFDEIAVEAALRLREAGTEAEIVAVSVGPAQAQDTLRAALAMGADRAIHLKTDAAVEPLAVAKLLQAVAQKEAADLVILGRQAIDGDAGQTGQMLASRLGWGQATFASAIEVADGHVVVTRETDGGQQVIAVNLPCIVTVDLRLNEPRFATLPNIMKAKKKPLEEVPADSFGVDLAPRLKVLRTEEPAPRSGGVAVENVAALVERLKSAGAI
ncbi:MAG TPA: electron transfer flavoprotein subunit beta/FixA family protein [Devosia sp.]|nr:electron transfer flavoprotein subunit beta/FixA family protein [Devosia sp.]